MNSVPIRRLLTIAVFVIAAAGLCKAQDGSVRVNVTPEEAYVFVDGQALIHRSNTLALTPGEHTIAVYNYGYVPQRFNVYIEKGANPAINARLQRVEGMVSGPWGRIQIEGVHGDSLVFLNGTTPEYFVAHADEANNDILNKQQIIAPVGSHDLYIMNHKTHEMIWSGPVLVKENQRLILYTDRGKGEIVYKGWPEGSAIASLKRFEAGTATATIAIPPVTGKFVADREQIKCGDPVKLTWTTTEAAKTTVMAGDKVLGDTLNGELSLQPKETTTYKFHTSGPGGVVTSATTVRVDNTVKTSLNPSAKELRFVKVGNNVTEQGLGKLNWTAFNADAIHLEPIGLVTGTSGTETVTAFPKQTMLGPVDETLTYKLTATNVCGGSDSSIASIHLTGAIEPEQVAEVKPPELPQNASPLPLLALLGAASLGVGAWARLRKGR
jgi:PEGA domain